MEHLIRFRWVLITGIVLLIIGGIPHLKKALSPNNELSIWFVENDPALKAYQDFNQKFGNDRVIVLAIYEKDGLFTPEKLQQIQSLSQRLPLIDGVKSVNSLSTVKDLVKVNIFFSNQIRFQPAYSKSFSQDPESINSIKKRVLSSAYLKGYVVNEEGTCAMMIINLETFEKIDVIRQSIIQNIETTAQSELNTDNIYLGGFDVISNGLNKLSKHDFGLFMGMTYLLMFFVVFFFFRRWQYVILSLGTMLIAVILTFSLYGYTGHQLNIFSVIIPSLIIVMGLINILHIINEFELRLDRRDAGQSRNEIIALSLRSVFRPCFYTAMTTMIGFFALLSSSTAVLKEFGLFASLGVLIAFICSFIFSAVLLYFIPLNNKGSKISNQIGVFLANFHNSIQLNTRKYWMGIVIIILLALNGVRKVKTDMMVLGYLPESNEVVQDHNYITDHWGNYFPMDFLVHAKGELDLKDPELLQALNAFQKEVVSIPEIESGFSILNLLDRFSQVTRNKNIDTLLNDSMAAERLVASMLGSEEMDFSKLVTKNFQTGRITFIGPMMGVSDLEEKVDQIIAISKKHLGSKASISVTSYPALYLKIMNYAVDSMVKSLFLALLLIIITLSFLLKSTKLAFIAMIPNLFPLLLMFAFMGYVGINLDLATATVASIALGVAVDDTIHFLSHYLKEKALGKHFLEAISATHFRIGRIIIISSIVLCVGFMVLFLASIKTVIYFGILTFVAVIGALIGDLVLLPLLLAIFDKR